MSWINGSRSQMHHHYLGYIGMYDEAKLASKLAPRISAILADESLRLSRFPCTVLSIWWSITITLLPEMLLVHLD